MQRKLTSWPPLLIIFVTGFFPIETIAQEQPDVRNKYGLFTIDNLRNLRETINADSNKRMVNIGNCLPGIVLDLRYATVDNFTGEQLYPSISTTYLRKPVADSLLKVIGELRKYHLTLKIFDAYRPYAVTEKMWEVVRDDRYAADPAKGSGHNRGAAVDVTLVDLTTHKELPMGTGFDNFSDTAHVGFSALPASILKNRQLLKLLMEKHGFDSLDTEWWHFSLPEAASFELLNLGFDELSSLDKEKN